MRVLGNEICVGRQLMMLVETKFAS